VSNMACKEGLRKQSRVVGCRHHRAPWWPILLNELLSSASRQAPSIISRSHQQQPPAPTPQASQRKLIWEPCLRS